VTLSSSPKVRSSVKRPKRRWEARWTDCDGKPRAAKGSYDAAGRFEAFATEKAADAHALAMVENLSRETEPQAAPEGTRPGTIDGLLDLFLDKHGRKLDPTTVRKLRFQLVHARTAFGDRDPATLGMVELEDWREEDLPDGTRSDCFKAFRQAIAWSVKRGLIERDPTSGIANPRPKKEDRSDIHPFEDWSELESIAAELDPRYAAIPIFATATGLRPEEWLALHRSDIDREGGVVHVRRRYTSGVVKEGCKTERERVVPLTRRALAALDMNPPRLDTPILFPAPRGGYLDLPHFRWDRRAMCWTAALRAAGIEHRRVYDMRHTFATWAIAAGVPTLTLAQVMGTSVAQLEATYVRWLKGTAESVRATLDAFDGYAVGE
jgi:integrase